jgi:hypothetical protein
MNLEYLKLIEFKEPSRQGFITKHVEMVENAIDADNNILIRPHTSIKLFFPLEVDGYNYTNFITDFKKVLKSKKHMVSEPIILSLTVFFLKLRDKIGYSNKAWGEFTQKMFTSCELHMEFLPQMELINMEASVQLKDYSIGRFDANTFRDKIKSYTKSDFYDRLIKGDVQNEEVIKNFLSFRRIEKKITVLDITRFASKFNYNLLDQDIFIDLYFEALSKAYLDLFWVEFDEQLRESVIFGGVYYNPMHYRNLGLGNGKEVCIYTKIGQDKKSSQNGWVIPSVTRINEMHFDSQSNIQDLNQKLESYYRKTQNKQSEFIHMLQIATKYISKGIISLYEENEGESLLNFWIALDTILNDDNYEARSNLLKNRITALTCHKFNTSHKSHYFLVNELYKMRSEYIHSSIEPDRNKLLDLRDICQEVFDILIRMHHNNQKYDDITLDNWYMDIDELVQNGRDLRKSNIELLENVGIIDIHEEL